MKISVSGDSFQNLPLALLLFFIGITALGVWKWRCNSFYLTCAQTLWMTSRLYIHWKQAMHDVLYILYRTPLLANVFYWLIISIVRTKSVGLQSACNRKEEEEVRRVGRVLQKVTSFNKLAASEMKLHLRKFFIQRAKMWNHWLFCWYRPREAGNYRL